MIIYKHTCTISGKCYIGKSVKTMMARWYEHCADAKYSPRRKFFAAMNKYGKDNWTHEVLFECDNEELLAEKEIEYMDLYDSVKNGYNTIHERGRVYTHRTDSIELMRIAQKERHARKRAEGTEGGWTRKDGGAMLGKVHPRKGKANPNCGPKKGQLGWKKVNGVRVWHKLQEVR